MKPPVFLWLALFATLAGCIAGLGKWDSSNQWHVMWRTFFFFAFVILAVNSIYMGLDWYQQQAAEKRIKNAEALAAEKRAMQAGFRLRMGVLQSTIAAAEKLSPEAQYLAMQYIGLTDDTTWMFEVLQMVDDKTLKYPTVRELSDTDPIVVALEIFKSRKLVYGVRGVNYYFKSQGALRDAWRLAKTGMI